MNEYQCIAGDVRLGKDVRLSKFINLYGCSIGDGTGIGAFVEIQKNACIGRNSKISSHAFICEGVIIEDEVFVGHGVNFINDRYPRAAKADGTPQTEADWTVEPTRVKKGASIGSGATILSGVVIGERAMVGAGSMVTRDVPAHAVVAGNPARVMRYLAQENTAGQCHDPIPFLDLVAPHKELEEELVSAFRQALETASFVGGSAVERFETAFAEFCTTSHAVGVGSGTDALRFAIMACGIQAGDVVITVPNTFIATTEAISQAGAIPEFIDIDEQTCNLSPKNLKAFLEDECARNGEGKLISRRHNRPVTAVIPVHLYGQMADMDSILSLGDKYGLVVIEDACQAHGAEYFSRRLGRWMRAGSMGRAAAFSFYPGKNLGACGEAGAVTTNDASIAANIKLLRDHGQAEKYYHDAEGYNGRLDAIQAGLLLIKLRHLHAWNVARRERAAEYNRLLAENNSLSLLTEPSWSRGVYHLYVVRTPGRDGLIQALKQAGIGTAIHYPIPLHLQNAYASFQYAEGSFPVAERIAREIVSLPMFPQLTAGQQARVAAEIAAFTSQSSAMQGQPSNSEHRELAHFSLIPMRRSENPRSCWRAARLNMIPHEPNTVSADNAIAAEVSRPARVRPAGCLIVNADDWGRDRETTDRTLNCFVNGSVSAVSAMVFTPDAERAASLAREHGLDAALHLNFTMPFSPRHCPAALFVHQQRIARFLRSSRFAPAIFHPGLARSFRIVVQAQLDEFERLYGYRPPRIDGHHHMHLAANVQWQGLLPAGTIVRRNFSFVPGEKSFVNRVYRYWQDRLLARRHVMTDFFFDILPLDRQRLERIAALGRAHSVEIETHPADPQQFDFLMRGELALYLSAKPSRWAALAFPAAGPEITGGHGVTVLPPKLAARK